MEEEKFVMKEDTRGLHLTEVRRSQGLSEFGLNIDCSSNRNCIWWKRFEDLSLEN